MPRPLKLDGAGKLKLSEADVMRQVEDFLAANRWNVIKTGYGEIARGGVVVEVVGQIGMPDRLAYRHKGSGYAEMFWIEGKRPKSKGDSGGRLSADQREWLMAETARGGLCVVVDDLDQFIGWYRTKFGR